MTRHLKASAVAVVFAATFVGATGAARADDSGPCPSSTEAPYSMELTALAGPAGADLTVSVAGKSGCALPKVLKKIQLKTFSADGSLAWTQNLKDVEAPGGIASGIDLGDIPRDRRIEADVLVQTGTPSRTYVLRGATKTLLRPDLVVEEIAPQQTLVGKPVVISTVIAERNGESNLAALFGRGSRA